MPEALGQRNDDEPANGFGRMQLNTQAIFEIVAPVTYWVIALLWAIILALLLKRASIFRAQDDALKVLVVVLALDAFRTLVENIYFGTLFNSYFGLLPISFMKALESPMLLAMPKLVNIGTGILILFLIVRRWIPATDNERLQANIQQALERKEWLDRLEAEQERLIRAQSVAKVGSWETNLTTLEATWSAEAFRIFEVDATSFVPSHAGLLSLMTPEDRRLMDEAFSRSLNTRDICTFEHRLVSADGRIKIVSERWRTFVDQRGVPSFALGTCQDLTEIRAAEAKAQEAIYQLRIAGNAALLGAWSYKVGDGHVEWSEQTASIHGMPAGFSPTVAEAIEFYAPEHRKKIENAFLACADSGKEFDETLEIVTPNGQRVWVRAIGEALLEEEGVVRKVHGAFQDITTLVANRKHLQFLETAISRISDIVMITEAEPINEPGPRIIFVNRSFEKLTGYSASEALGNSSVVLAAIIHDVGRSSKPPLRRARLCGLTVGSSKAFSNGHARQPRVSVSRSIFPLVDDRDRAYFGGDQSTDQIGVIDDMRAVFGRSYAAEPDQLIDLLKADEAIAEADTLLLTVPNQLGVDYNAHVIESILTYVAPALGWR